jgi:hypothetical protein
MLHEHVRSQPLPRGRFIENSANNRIGAAILKPASDQRDHKKRGHCTLARRADAKTSADAWSGVRRRDTRSPGAVHLERLAAKYVRSGTSEASGTALGSNLP